MLNILHFYISTFRSVCAVPNMAVFCSSLISCFPGMLLMYFLKEFEIVPVAPIITGITLLLLLILLLHVVAVVQISFMQDIYNYILQKEHVSTVHSVADVL